MNTIGTIGLAVVAAIAVTPAALAADAYAPIPLSSGEALGIYDHADFDWNGFYGGLYGVAQTNPAGWGYGAGLALGVNKQIDYFLLGAEVAVHGLTINTANRGYGQILARGGLVLTDELLAYGAVGYGLDFGPLNNQHILVGGGLEYAVTENVSLRGQYLYGIPANGTSTPINQVTFGANWHF